MDKNGCLVSATIFLVLKPDRLFVSCSTGWPDRSFVVWAGGFFLRSYVCAPRAIFLASQARAPADPVPPPTVSDRPLFSAVTITRLSLSSYPKPPATTGLQHGIVTKRDHGGRPARLTLRLHATMRHVVCW